MTHIIEKTAIYLRSPDVVSRKIVDEYILVPIVASSEDVDSIFNLNEMGGWIWENIDGKSSIGELCQKLTKEFDVDFNEALSDISSFLDQLSTLSAVQKV